MSGRRPIALIVLLVLVAILAGCSSSSDNTPAKLSKGEKEKLIKKLNADYIDRYPNEQGIVKIYGELANGTNRHLISATVAASDIHTKGKNVIYGKLVVEDIKPGESVPFEIPSGRGIGEMGDTIIISVIDAEFR